jgi:hypothetical protein
MAYMLNTPLASWSETNGTSKILATSGTLSASDEFCINGTGDVYFYNPTTSTVLADPGTSYTGYGSLGGVQLAMSDTGLLQVWMENSSYTAWVPVYSFNTTAP